jgi:hypothetical protein
MTSRIIRFSRPRKPEPAPWLMQPADVYQRDDGYFQIGICDDAPGPFESRAFAEAVAARRSVIENDEVDAEVASGRPSPKVCRVLHSFR